MSKHRIGWRRLCAALVLCALLLNLVPVTGVVATAESSFDPYSDYWIELYTIDANGKRYYIGNAFPNCDTHWNLEGMLYQLTDTVWNGWIKQDYARYTSLTYPKFETASNNEAMSFLHAGVTRSYDDGNPLIFYSKGDYQSLMEDPDIAHFLEWNPLFTVSYTFGYREYNYREWTYEDLCSHTDTLVHQDELPSVIADQLTAYPYNDRYADLYAPDGYADENGCWIQYGPVDPERRYYSDWPEPRADGMVGTVYFYGEKHAIPNWMCPWHLKENGYTLDEMFEYYRSLHPDILFKDYLGSTYYDLRFSYPVYAKINSGAMSRYMYVDLDGGKAYSNGMLFADGNCVFQGALGETIEYPENLSFRKPGYEFDGWNVMIVGEGAQDTMRITGSLDATMGEYSTQWTARWVEVPVTGFTLQYDRNAEDALGAEMPNDYIGWGERKPLSYPTYYYPHHRFVKWSQYPDGSGHWCPVKDYGRWDDVITSEHLRLEDFGSENITLYAQWTDQGDASFALDERKGYYDKYCVEDFYAIDCYTGEKKEPSSNVNNVFTAFSGDAVTFKIKPYIGYRLKGIYFETEHSGRQLYTLGNNNAIQSNNGLYDDLAVEKDADGSYTFTFTMKNDHIFSIEPKLLFSPDGTYVDENGETRNCIEEGASPVAFSPNDTEWKTGWYIVDGDCTLVTRPAVKGDVKLILCDGATLTAPRGIVVCGDNSLSIYGQSEGTGKLIATGQEKSDYYYEGRGYEDCVNYESTAIGLAGLNEVKYPLEGGTINIYGGDITAVGQKTREGIGVGYSGRIAIYGGTIRASSIREGNAHAPGIMTEDHDVYFAPGMCVIGYDGTIAAVDRRAAVAGDYDHDAVVCPCEHDEGYLTVEGCSYCGETVYRALTLVQSEGGTFAADAGSGPEGYGQIGEDIALTFTPDQGHHVESVTITDDNGTSTTAVPEDDAYSFTMPGSPVTVTAEWARNTYTVSFDANGGSGETDAVSGLYEDAVALPVSEFTAPDGKTFFGWCTEADGSGVKYSAGQSFTITEDATLYARWSGGLYYIDENTAPTVPDGSCSEIIDESVDWNESIAEFYVVTNDVTLDERVCVSGDVGLILCDGAALTVSEGIAVPKGSSLAIYSQNADTGRLICESSSLSEAAIGGTEGVDCGKITICGGVITASGGYYASGIGAGESAEYEEINIYGGTVTAYGGEGGGAGIGGGSWACYGGYTSNSGKINIDGKRNCTVNAYGGDDGSAGIGGGYGQGAGTIDISNATVQAVGGCFGSGIGAGINDIVDNVMYEDTGTIRIHSGNITASSCAGGTGIGCGAYAPDFGTIEISGGTIVATGSGGETASFDSSGAGIGGSADTSGGSIIITGGNITATGGSYKWYGHFSPGIGASEATVSVSGSARITATGGNTWGIDGTIAISAPAVVFGSVNESNLTRDQILSLKYAASGAEGEVPAPVYAPSGTELTAAERGSLAYDEHVFFGWNTDEAGSGAAYAENGDIVLDADTTLYAQWKPTVNNIIIAETTNGTVTATVGETENATAARYDEPVTLTVTPAEGYAIDSVSYNDGTDHTVAPVEGVYSFAMPLSDVTVSATFVANTYTVSFDRNAADAAGTMEVQGFTYGTAQSLTPNIYARTGCDFASWNTVAAPTGENPGTAYTNGQEVQNLTAEANGSVILYAQWTPRVYSLAIADTSNGTVTAKVGETENTTTAHYNEPVTLIVTPAEGYAIDSVSYNDGTDHTVAPVDGVYAFSMPADGVTVTATFIQIFTVSFAANGGTGAMDPATVNSSATYTLPACGFTAPEGRTFAGWQVGEAIKQPNETVTVNGDMTVTATWAQIDFAITVQTDGPGTLTATAGDETAATAHFGEEVALTVGPKNGYTLSSLTVDGADVTADVSVNAYTFAMPAHDVTVSATFTQTEPVVAGYDLVLDGTLGLRFYVGLPEGFDDDNACMTFSLHGRTQNVPLSDAQTIGGYRVFTCNVQAHEMAESITATFHYGENQSVADNRSIRQYLAKFENDGSKTGNLVAATMNYGHYVQPYMAEVHGWTFGEGKDYAEMTGANAITEPMTGAPDYAHQWGLNGVDTDVVEKMQYYLTLDSSTTLNITVKFKTAPDAVSATVDGRDRTATSIGDNTWLIEITDIASNNLGKPYHVEITADGSIVFDLNVSALSYVHTVLTGTRASQEERLALTALYNYYTAACAYNAP